MKKERNQNRPLPSEEKTTVSSEHQNIIKWLKNVRFRKQLFGGVSEADVWKKIDELNQLYDEALMAEHIRCETLLTEFKKGNISSESEGE